ncbi:MAG: TraY domain-containing protein [Planctomycetota bacterium]
MAVVVLKGVPEKLHRRLKERAGRNRRSLTGEALHILEDALVREERIVSLAEVDRRRVRPARPLSDRMINNAKRRGRK